MRHNKLGENVIHMKKILSWKCDIKNLAKILYFGNISKLKMRYKELGKNFIFSKRLCPIRIRGLWTVLQPP